MTGVDKVVGQAATLLLLFTLTSMPAKAQFTGFGGGGGGEDMMTQMAPNRTNSGDRPMAASISVNS